VSDNENEKALPPFRHMMQTPTVALTASGVLCSILWVVDAYVCRVPYVGRHADFAAFLFFLLTGGGVAMALGSEVTRKGFTWGWKGLLGAIFRQPSIFMIVGVLGHMLQLAAAISIAMIWRRRCWKE